MKGGMIHQQRGVSIIGAIFLITGLSLLGALLSRMMVVNVEETMSEWYASQAFYAAESGLDYAAYNVITATPACTGAGTINTDYYTGTVNPGLGSGLLYAGFSVDYECESINGDPLYKFTITGSAGESAAVIKAQRQLEVHFMP
jgi:hypothetical protein